MTAEELLVERFLEKEQKLEDAEMENLALEEALCDAQAEIADFERIVCIIAQRLKVSKYGVSFELKNYVAEEKADIDFLANYFDVTFEEETQGEG